MKWITIFALAIGASSPAAAAQTADVSVRSTSKPVEQFVRCFVAEQERASFPWWFVPKDHGGTISNAGANGAKSAYFVGISDRGPIREVRLELATTDPSALRSIAQAVNQCV